MKKTLLMLVALTGALTLASCGPLGMTPTPTPTAPAPVVQVPAAPALRYSVEAGTPVDVTVNAGDVVTVARAAGVERVAIRWSSNPERLYALTADRPALAFKASAGLVGEYETGNGWAPFLKVTAERP